MVVSAGIRLPIAIAAVSESDEIPCAFGAGVATNLEVRTQKSNASKLFIQSREKWTTSSFQIFTLDMRSKTAPLPDIFVRCPLITLLGSQMAVKIFEPRRQHLPN